MSFPLPTAATSQGSSSNPIGAILKKDGDSGGLRSMLSDLLETKWVTLLSLENLKVTILQSILFCGIWSHGGRLSVLKLSKAKEIMIFSQGSWSSLGSWPTFTRPGLNTRSKTSPRHVGNSIKRSGLSVVLRMDVSTRPTSSSKFLGL